MAGRYFAQIAIVGATLFAAGKLGDILSNGSIGPVWPASGIALGAVLLFGYSVWPAIAAGAFLIGFLPPQPLPVGASIIYAAGTALAAMVGAFLLRRIAKFDCSVCHLRDAIGLIVLGAFISSTVSASIGAAVLYGHLRGWSGFGSAWLIYWLGDSTGVLLVTPVVLTFPKLIAIRERNRIVEVAALLFLLTAGGFIVFGDLLSIPGPLHVLAFAVLPLVMWAAIRLGISVTALSIFTVGTIATVETALGSGPFTTNTPLMNAVLLDVFFGVVSVTGLVLAAVIAEREDAEREREKAISKQAGMEARLQAAKVLQSSEQRWRLAAQAGKMYSYEWDAATDLVTRSGEVASILGIPGEASSLTRQQVLDRVHPDDRALFAPSEEQTPQNPDAQFIYRMLRPDGSVIWLEKTSHAFFDKHERIVRMVGNVANITERKLAEEARFRHAVILESSDDAIVSKSPDGTITGWNAGAERIYGYTEAEMVGKSITILVPSELADEEDRILASLRAGERIEHYETIRVTKAGKRINVSLTISPIKDSSGKIIALSGIARDITGQKRAQEALAQLGRKLIHAHEEERARIARELHDDINQRVAISTIEVDALRQSLPESAVELGKRADQIKLHLQELGNDIQAISHRLHSSKLEYLGLAAACRSFSKEVAERQSVRIDFEDDGVPRKVPQDISLALFRVLQESLQNGIKHSGAKQFEVRLRGGTGEIQLTIRDYGVGFDLAQAIGNHGLGLISMRERVSLVKGTILITSKPQHGTEIDVHIPLIEAMDAKVTSGAA